MKCIEFVKKLNDVGFTNEGIEGVCRTFISGINKENCNINKKDLNNFFDQLKEEKFSELKLKLDKCKNYCEQEQKITAILGDDEYSSKIKLAESAINQIIDNYIKKFQNKNASKNDHSYVLEQHDAKLAEINVNIASLDSKVKEATKSIDDKMFTLLINTVAILGIFVAIAFTGFGITAIFPKIDISVALQNNDNLIKIIFFFLLISVICYNLLLLLVYFIFRLSRPLYASLNKEKIENVNDDDSCEKNL